MKNFMPPYFSFQKFDHHLFGTPFWKKMIGLLGEWSTQTILAFLPFPSIIVSALIFWLYDYKHVYVLIIMENKRPKLQSIGVSWRSVVNESINFVPPFGKHFSLFLFLCGPHFPCTFMYNVCGASAPEIDECYKLSLFSLSFACVFYYSLMGRLLWDS